MVPPMPTLESPVKEVEKDGVKVEVDNSVGTPIPAPPVVEEEETVKETAKETVKEKLYRTPMDIYPKAEPVPHKVEGTVAAHLAATDPDYKVEKAVIESTLDLRDKVAVVTGGASGLGLEYSLAMAEKGATVYAWDLIDEEKISEVEGFTNCQSYLKKMDSPGSLHYKKVNVTCYESTNEEMERIGALHDGVHIVVANAGILGENKDCIDYDPNVMRRVVDVNICGAFITLQAAARVMVDRKIQGSLIATASMSGSIVNKDMHWVPYNMSKAAVVLMAKSFACELGRTGIRVNSISPGHISTPMTQLHLNGDPHLENQWANQNPMGRLGASHEVRGVLLYLASDMSTYVTGADHLVCGGHTAW